jgi:NitT/TauT family transport system permease protein
MSARRWEHLQDLLLGALGLAVFLGAWELVGRQRWLGMAFPPFSDLIAFAGNPSKRQMLLGAGLATTKMVLVAYLDGALTGLLAAVASHFCRLLRPGMDRFASLLHSIPTIALAPIFIVLFDRAYAGVAISGISVFFVVYVALTSGLAGVPRAGQDLFYVLGAPRLVRFLHLELPSSLPTLASGLSYAVPVAFMGVILGEWFGATRGIGLLMVSAMQNFQISLLWCSVTLISAISLCAYGAMTGLARFVQRQYR